MEDPLTKRRRFLQGVGVSGTALLAGCSGILDSQESDDETPEDDDGSTDGGSTDDGQDGTDTDDGSSGDDSIERGEGDTREVGMVAEPDQEALQELQQQVQAREIEQAEAVERQQEIIQEAIDALKDVLQSETDIEVNEEYPELGAVRATGDPYELVDSLTSARVSVLISPERLQIEQQPSG